jgi:hypothetical protein
MSNAQVDPHGLSALGDFTLPITLCERPWSARITPGRGFNTRNADWITAAVWEAYRIVRDTDKPSAYIRRGFQSLAQMCIDLRNSPASNEGIGTA